MWWYFLSCSERLAPAGANSAGERQRGSDLPLDDGSSRTAIDQRNLIVVLKYRMDFVLIAFVKLIKSLVQAFWRPLGFRYDLRKTQVTWCNQEIKEHNCHNWSFFFKFWWQREVTWLCFDLHSKFFLPHFYKVNIFILYKNDTQKVIHIFSCI